MPGWRQRDAYSRDEASGSQLHVLPHCYEGSVTGVTDAIQRAGGPDLRGFVLQNPGFGQVDVGDSMLQGNPATLNWVGIRSDFS